MILKKFIFRKQKRLLWGYANTQEVDLKRYVAEY